MVNPQEAWVCNQCDERHDFIEEAEECCQEESEDVGDDRSGIRNFNTYSKTFNT